MELDISREWLEVAAELEDGCPVGVGGLQSKSELKQFILEGLDAVFDVLDDKLGDTDPYFPVGLTDEEIRDDVPLFWCARKISAMVEELKKPTPESGIR